MFASIVLAGVVSLAGCSHAESPSSVSATGAGPSATAPAEDTCAGAADTVKQHVRRSEVGAVTVEGQCTTVVVATTLADDDTGTAKQLCDAAAEVAYSDDINSVRVLSRSGKELSNGIAGMRCLP